MNHCIRHLILVPWAETCEAHQAWKEKKNSSYLKSFMMSHKASAYNKQRDNLVNTPLCSAPCRSYSYSPNLFRKTSIETKKESLSVFALEYKIPLQIYFIALKQTSLPEFSSGSDPEKQWKQPTLILGFLCRNLICWEPIYSSDKSQRKHAKNIPFIFKWNSPKWTSNAPSIKHMS